MIANISGTNVEIKIDKSFEVVTNIAYDLYELESGNYTSTDYSSSADTYETIVTTYGVESYINNIITKINNVKDNQYITLSGFASNEKIFGVNVNHTSALNVLYTGFNYQRESRSFKGFGLKLSFKLINPSFIASTFTNLSAYNCVEYQYVGDTINDISYYQTCNGQDYSVDRNNYTGRCKLTYNITEGELIQLRNWHRVNRGTPFTYGTIKGVSYPFGPINTSTMAIIENLKYEPFGINRFRAELDLISYN